MAQAQAPLDGVLGVIAFAFPLHSGPPSIKRAAHLASVNLPMLFLSGTRDAMADPKLLEGVVGGLKGATLHRLDTADHSFKPLTACQRRASDCRGGASRLAMDDSRGRERLTRAASGGIRLRAVRLELARHPLGGLT